MINQSKVGNNRVSRNSRVAALVIALLKLLQKNDGVSTKKQSGHKLYDKDIESVMLGFHFVIYPLPLATAECVDKYPIFLIGEEIQ